VAGDDLSLRATIEAVLDAKGFDDLKASVDRMADSVARTGPKVSGTVDVFDRLGRRLPTQGLHLLSDSLLRNAGAMRGASQIANVLTHTVGALTFGLGPLGLAIGAVAVAAGIAATALGKKKEEAAKLAAQTKTLEDNTLAYGDQLRQLKERGMELTPAMETMIRLERELARVRAVAGLVAAKEMEKKQKEIVGGLKDEIAAETESLSWAKKRVESMRSVMEATGQTTVGFITMEATVSATEKSLKSQGEALEKASLDLQLASAHVDFLNGTMKAGEPTAAAYLNTLAEGARRAAEEVKETERWYERLAARMERFHNEEVQATEAGERTRDRMRERERERQLETAKQIVSGLEKNREEALKAVQKIEDDERESAQKRLDIQTGIAVGSADIIRSVFGKNKAASIISAIIDTYAAANVALKSAPPPANFVLMAAAIAAGLANVAKIKESEAGFDVLESDMLAASFGKKWAADFLRLVDSGFAAAVDRGPTPGIRSVHNTTINRGTQIHGGVSLGGFFGSGKTQLLKQLNRELIVINRLENRTALR